MNAGQVMWEGRASWRSPTMIKHVASTTFLALFAIAILYGLERTGVLNGFLMIIGSLVTVGAFIGITILLRNSHVYRISNVGVTVSSGFPIRTNEHSISFRKVESIMVNQSLCEKVILRTGTVTVSSGAGDSRTDDVNLVGVASPRNVQRVIRQGEHDVLSRNVQHLAERMNDDGYE